MLHAQSHLPFTVTFSQLGNLSLPIDKQALQNLIKAVTITNRLVTNPGYNYFAKKKNPTYLTFFFFFPFLKSFLQK